ncbi:glycerol-3-phosphate dehydrogenase [Rhizobium sp. 007]|uniref:NAD(P)H-dependent glycerol-3-phosphate dehydrogenase n=1 Tax=Rhizobium sp. 007 TaxID=2785056 RepID=UPI0018901CE1|nr:glycerol-3-phosphate dehydrogenase [Rhizobium sp. 007]QPB22288.1 glycerol-3-phosphate dehydrogenase [Rhizobium sp. 007]
MAKIVILGAGVMGTALTVPATDNGHNVLLVGTPLDRKVIAELHRRGGSHPKLDEPCSRLVTAISVDDLGPEHLEGADIVIVGVSSPGIGWAVDVLNNLMANRLPVAFVTKGLAVRGEGLATYAETLPPQLRQMHAFIGIGGPCIARELANRQPTASIYACKDLQVAERFAALMRTDYYRLSITTDDTGVEACAALKNFFAIGVSAMQTRYPDKKRGGGQSKNPTAAAFTQATLEMARLCERLGGHPATAFGLAGLGDLHVTVGGGRNSRLGHGLGRNQTIMDLMSNELAGETVEGVDTARALATMILGNAAIKMESDDYFPLTFAIMDSILEQKSFVLDFANLIVR